MDREHANNDVMAQGSFTARLHALLAREAPYGVVIRRGPSHCTRFHLAPVCWREDITLGELFSAIVTAGRGKQE